MKTTLQGNLVVLVLIVVVRYIKAHMLISVCVGNKIRLIKE